ncbi:hypothetical protein PZB74_05095 [Porifericola rhodea]|uniref:hypothetical protein n=1 Tax=Porifericola rhodea TaxID=930972 RepID=UPI0026670BA5|nr:hypothetical protein [Porifericola rhodea]WKN32720.1 hypothetical protein PZB74_05095 [Porifericola rhodea]
MKTTALKLCKQGLFCLFIFALLSACASSKQAANSPVGTWDYTVKNTPYGDVKGQMIITQSGDTYQGELRSEMGSLKLEDLNIEENQLNSTAMMDGNKLAVEGSFEGDSFNGKVVASSYDSYPMSASRVK